MGTLKSSQLRCLWNVIFVTRRRVGNITCVDTHKKVWITGTKTRLRLAICKPNGSLITFSPPLFTVSSDPPKLDSRFSSLSVVVVGQIMTGRATPPFTSPPMYTFYCIISYQMCTFNKERDASIQTSKNWTLHPALFCGQKFLGKMDSNLRTLPTLKCFLL